MKKAGILHPEISQLIASMGHTDYVVLADKGYPVPEDKKRINLGITDDLPTVPDLLKVIETELNIERIIVTEEMEAVSLDRLLELKQLYPNILFEKITHLEFKALTKEAQAVIKTGDTCAYANIIIVSG
ncbi:D-ribose pyranase [Virgibacillus profundi]|uniref:D-ribose pyranase n=1 Tax=Virgibacillus profundi TaxID=2024555 RepID=A0A2A2IIV9_9BACI|nr:D-ribose pyranase [Virgibacillus profundi]PAV31204.1 D-ribose pyranase [Virgibacillus profundi]PXY55386.1 D-ribose pyranase [Virgibacillus profundi]